MTGKTHASCGVLVGALTTQYFHTDLFSSVTIIIIATIASLLPDICHTQSKIGRRFKVISFFIRLFIGHRTFTHSILFIILIASLLHLIYTPIYYMAAVIAGLASHIILDMLTPKGVKLLYPLPFDIKSPITFKTGGLLDLSLATALTIGAVYVLFQTYIDDIMNYWNIRLF
ncbi:metal-dependent hydrolase [Staphylococcus simiae]|uniref:Membrane-bound metal-dependent hydrolase n=1 Tax=Staphylococcus simiae CCM 7213 = CCUG 51256 TaxID=911238 RepID=G5JF19_9STAP|nr:metal-dependent hydrolase [Staphylococcus simiae]EHJ09211.1 hypothetical protein SS7213T_00052 [Staphylococcus simiae CCM 7213 = CCUG 51256]PNZ13743.1 metal-dependent hydrolase [Staphylococcus simiae]SNV77925.1 membrane-bound metal-dependent hydrolase [Staphylococcus simiae]